MQPSKPICCWQCGTVISTTGGRCPACGVEQHSSEPLHTPAVLPAPPLRPLAPRASTLAGIPLSAFGGGAVALLIGAVLLVLLLGRSSVPAPESTPATAVAAVAAPEPASPTDPNDLGLEDRTRADPSALLARATTRALAWSKEAVLVELKAGPVVAGKVDLTQGGTIEFVFGKPTGEGFGADTRVTGNGLRILAQGTSTTIDEGVAVAGRAALEPNCPFAEALRKAQAAGLLSTTAPAVSYEVSSKHGKPAWRFSVADDPAQTRLVDGNSCAILVR